MLLLLATLLADPTRVDPAPLRVVVDSSAQTVTITAGPFAIAGAMPDMDAAEHHGMHDNATEFPGTAKY